MLDECTELYIRWSETARSVEDELVGGGEVSKTIREIDCNLSEKIEHSSLSTSYLNEQSRMVYDKNIIQ